MSVLRLFVLNRTARSCSHMFHSLRNSCQLFCTPRNCRPISFDPCFNSYRLGQSIFDKQIDNKNCKTGVKYSQAKRAEIKYSDEKCDSCTGEPRIIYNSIVKRLGFIAEKRRQKILRKKNDKSENQKEINCIAIKYFCEEEFPSNDKSSLESDADNTKLNLPFSIHMPTLIDEETNEVVGEERSNTEKNINIDNNENTNDLNDSVKTNVSALINDNTSTAHRNWMFDYECFKDEDNLDNVSEDQSWKLNYGTPDPDVPVSKVPCGGCGALLHCQDPAIPGYLPTELFLDLKIGQLRGITCQRCHFLKQYNAALAVNIDPKEYPKMLSKIKDEKALVLLMVDMTDFPCSIWPGILSVVGPKRPLFVIGNKIDLLQGDSNKWLERAKKALQSALPKNANVKHLCLISAKTGFGVEELINKLFNVWEYRGDVYLVGCTNVGKSTLFNCLLQSDYCKVKAADLLQRATTSPWPGTTLNLLKFPIQRPKGWRLFYRTKRLQHVNKVLHQENMLLKQQNALKLKQKIRFRSPQLIGHVGQTFRGEGNPEDINPDPFSIPNKQQLKKPNSGSGLNPDDKDFKDGNWLHDTPGTVQPDQILDLLTIEELMVTLPKQMIVPRTFLIKPNQSLFVGGLGRLDYVEGDTNVKFTVCSSLDLPITVCHTEDAGKVYDYYVGTNVLGVPFGNKNRMSSWPGLHPGEEFVLRGISHTESCADVVLSSAGWIVVTPGPQMICKFLAWTPHSRGIHVRLIPVLPYIVNVRGNRISKTVAYSVIK